MSISAHSNRADRGRRLLPAALATLVLAGFVADFMAPMASESMAAWLSGIEVIAVLALVAGGAVLMWQGRTESAARMADKHGHAQTAGQASGFRVADGGTGLPGRAAGRRTQRTVAPMHDGGAFPSPRR